MAIKKKNRSRILNWVDWLATGAMFTNTSLSRNLSEHYNKSMPRFFPFYMCTYSTFGAYFYLFIFLLLWESFSEVKFEHSIKSWSLSLWMFSVKYQLHWWSKNVTIESWNRGLIRIWFYTFFHNPTSWGKEFQQNVYDEVL